MSAIERESAAGGLRLAELLAALSLATDLGMGQPLEQALRTCLIALGLGERLRLRPDELSEIYYVALLRFVGCSADASETAAMVGGDDIARPRGNGAGCRWLRPRIHGPDAAEASAPAAVRSAARNWRWAC